MSVIGRRTRVGGEHISSCAAIVVPGRGRLVVVGVDQMQHVLDAHVTMVDGEE
jgi:hypothetical protein